MKKSILRVGLVTGLMLLIPLVAMQFSEEVKWEAFDFIVMGALLFCTGMAYEFVASRSATLAYKGAIALTLLTSLVLMWMNLAVGIIGSEDTPANALYLAVLAVGFLGTITARLEAPKMVRVLYAMALTQALVPVIAFLVWKPSIETTEETAGVAGVFILNTVYVVLYLGAALLFRNASKDLKKV